ncbi:OsmC family protein [Pseudomonas sp.]|uniref:OsmC family protein n=1 Tax=Pseudomonas sp. TaxID=306 RepID=UPI0037C81AEA
MTQPQHSNGIDVNALQQFSTSVNQNLAAGKAGFAVHTTWMGGTRTRATTGVMTLGDRALTRPYVITADEPQALLGRDSAPNPQELLLAALNACMAIDYVANAAAMGIEIDSMTIRSSGELDLRGFLGLDVAVNPGYDTVTVEVDIHSMAPPERLKELHTRVRRTSPNVNCFVRPINLDIRTRHYPFESCTAQRT